MYPTHFVVALSQLLPLRLILGRILLSSNQPESSLERGGTQGFEYKMRLGDRSPTATALTRACYKYYSCLTETLPAPQE